MVQRREIAISIILSIVTCGIYGIYWFIVLNNDIKKVSGDETLPDGGIALLLTLVTCGIYGIYWAYRMGKALAAAQTKMGTAVVSDNSVLYLILQLFGLGIINYALMQNQVNLIVDGGNNSNNASNGSNNGDSNTNQSNDQQPVEAEEVEETTVVEEE